MATKSKKTDSNGHEELKWPYGKLNYIYFAIAVIVIAIGYFTLSNGSMTLAPILLVIGYLVLIPIALMVKDKSIADDNADDSESNDPHYDFQDYSN